jgi:hypothetical protein
LPGEIRASPILCLQVGHIGRSTFENESRITLPKAKTIFRSRFVGLSAIRLSRKILESQDIDPFGFAAGGNNVHSFELVCRVIDEKLACTAWALNAPIPRAKAVPWSFGLRSSQLSPHWMVQ